MNTDTTNFAGHTPGPWQAFQGAKDIAPFVAAGTGKRDSICECYTFEHRAEVPNARLIAAAPELLAERDQLREALVQALLTLDRLSDEDLPDGGLYVSKMIRTALAACGKGAE